MTPLQRATTFSRAFDQAGFKGLPSHPAVYGDTQRLSHTYSVRFSLKKSELRLAWDPSMPPTGETLESLATVYLAARDSFLRMASVRLGRRLVALTLPELKTVVDMHMAGLATPTFTVGQDVAVVDPLNLHRGPMVFVGAQHD